MSSNEYSDIIPKWIDSEVELQHLLLLLIINFLLNYESHYYQFIL